MEPVASEVYRDTVYRRARDMWGRAMQTVICMEECAELTQELSKTIRFPDRCSDNLLGEIADVFICIESIMLMYGIQREEFNKRVYEKINRLTARMDKEEAG
jgi:NTP pyrophosphatase (non-canonical NTP hydrolase)